MSTIKMILTSVNGRSVNIPTFVQTIPHGSNREEVENRVEDHLISLIDRGIMSDSIK